MFLLFIADCSVEIAKDIFENTVREKAKDLVELFTNDYLSVNPEK